MSNPNISSVIIGASKVSQIEDNCRALKLLDKFTPKMMHRIREVLDNEPEFPQNFGRTR